MSHIVAHEVTSLPVPEVLGIAINGQAWLIKSCSLYRYFLEEYLLDCNIDTCLSRIDKKDRMESEGKEFLIRVKNGFLELAKLNRNRYVIVDANKSINPL